MGHSNDLKIIGDGKRGENGRDGRGYTGHATQFGVNGVNGEHATAATDGGNAQTVHIFLSRAVDASSGYPPSCILAAVDIHKHQCIIPKPHSKDVEETIHDLGADGQIILSACGGDGGLGGSGGDGQGGGHGRRGRDATRASGGTNGEGGGNGGNAGDGTSGADGGRAGDIKILIKEEDLDLLVAMPPPRVSGGRGGKAGRNGHAGKGGAGGAGGSSYSWYEEIQTDKGTHRINHYNPGGIPGSDGQDGADGRARLEDGSGGSDGSLNIFIQDLDGQLTGPFQSAYKLEVLDFEIVNVIEDSVLEFGEKIILQNIRIKNIGGLPSPKFAEVAVRGTSTEWLVSPSTILKVPVSIPSGSIVKLTGTLVFKIKRPTSFPVGESFTVKDSFVLGAHISKIDRDVPRFHDIPKSVTLRHAIEMSKPRFLRCMTSGQEALFSWGVDNNSDKDLGIQGTSKRQIRNVISETGGALIDLGVTLGAQLEIPTHHLERRRRAEIEMVVKILPTALPYQRTQARVSLHFTPPDNSDPTSIQDFDLPIQISNAFRHDPEADVLLVTNFGTTGEEVEGWHSLVCEQLRLKMDIWNLSLNGHLELLGGNPGAGRQSLFQLYQGKTIVMLNNSFQYFDVGERNALEFIDSKDFAPASLGGTSLFVSGMEFEKTSWAFHMFRLLHTSKYPVTREFKTVKHLVKGILNARHDSGFFNTKFICLISRQGDDIARLTQKAARAASELRRRIPSLRFFISWTSTKQLHSELYVGAGQIEVLPQIPFDRSKFIITGSNSARRFEEVNKFGILMAIPFSRRLEMMWNGFGNDIEKGDPQTELIDTIEYDMVSELGRFTSGDAPWPDCIHKHDVFACLKRLDAFLCYDLNLPFSRSSIGRVATMLGNLMLLADCCSGSWPLALTFGTRRKNTCSQLTHRINSFLTNHYGHLGDGVALATYTQYVTDQTSQLKSENVVNRRERVLQRVAAKLPSGIGFNGEWDETADITDVEKIGNMVVNEEVVSGFRLLDDFGEKQLNEDLEHVKEELDAMSRLPTYE